MECSHCWYNEVIHYLGKSVILSFFWWRWVFCLGTGPFGFYATCRLDEYGVFPLPSLQTIGGEQLVQGLHSLPKVRFEPANLWLCLKNHTTALHPTVKIMNSNILAFVWILFELGQVLCFPLEMFCKMMHFHEILMHNFGVRRVIDPIVTIYEF